MRTVPDRRVVEHYISGALDFAALLDHELGAEPHATPTRNGDRRHQAGRTVRRRCPQVQERQRGGVAVCLLDAHHTPPCLWSR